MFLLSEDCQREQQSTHHNDHWRSHDQYHQYCGRNIHIDDNPIRSNDVPAPRYGKQYLASEWRIRTPVDHRGTDWRLRYPDFNVSQSVRMIEVFESRKKEAELDNPLSFDQCSISSLSLYTDFVCTTSQLIKWCWSMPGYPHTRWLRHRNGHRNGECEWCLPCSNWCIVERTPSISL